ncbi:MAG: hypothetical protein Q8O76_09040, partial [Chloroflexota bacterium]|nr:hypothetical protein [Chloroflexota bacterium]
MKARILSAARVLSLIISLASLPFSPRAEALTISYAAAAPNMVSLFGDLTSSGTVPDSPLGPGWSTLAVRT